VVVFWFTYTPDGRQAWMVGTGVLNDGVAEVDFEITDDAVFGADFDPLQLSRRSWGSLHLDFLNCNQAYAEYAGKFGSGQLNLTRLSAINGLDCADADNIEVSGNAADSGAWFNPERNGEGFIVETVGESSVLAYWFTYDTEGHQMWLLGVGDLDPAQQARIPMQKASGGRFGDAFDPASVSLEDWGDVSLQLGDCNHASYTWNAPAPYGAGGFDLVRLTSLKNVVCSPNPGSGQ